MKIIAILILVQLITKTGSGQICHPQLFVASQDGQCNNMPYVLVFEDNFDGNSLDLSKWQIQAWGQGSLSGDNTQQYYSLDNVSVSSGICSIIAKQDTVLRKAISWLPDSAILADSMPNLRTFYFTSSNIWTNHKFGHGIYEIRCRIPSGKGFWPAFWMYGIDSTVNNEIDVFEFSDGNTAKHQMTAHYNGMMCGSNYSGPDYSLAFHTYKVVWDQYKIEWYVDSILKKRLSKFNNIIGQTVDCNGVVANSTYILEKTFPVDSMNIITNLAIQTGAFAPDSTTVFPNSLDIDYIRYYKQDLDTGTGTGIALANKNLNLKIYPNPSNGSLFVQFVDYNSANYEISLFDEQGKVVFKSASANESTICIDLSKFPGGIYLLHILDPKNNMDFDYKVILTNRE
ncbi:MAG: family 16 glycosylhydrolase [Bacteroidota bacterium]